MKHTQGCGHSHAPHSNVEQINGVAIMTCKIILPHDKRKDQ